MVWEKKGGKCRTNSSKKICKVLAGKLQEVDCCLTQLHVATVDLKATAWENLGLICRALNQLTAWSKGLHEKPTRPKLRKKFPAFYENRKFITACTTARQSDSEGFLIVVT